MQGITEVRLCQFRFFDVVPIGFIDDDTVGHFHDTPFYTLQFVAGPGQLDKEKEIDHRVHGRFGLTHTHSFDKNRVESRRFAQDDGFSRFTGHTAQRTGRGRRSDKSVFLLRKPFHTGLVSENTPFRTYATGVDGQYGKFSTPVEHMKSESIDRCTFPDPGTPVIPMRTEFPA